MTVDEALVVLKTVPKNTIAWEIVALDVYKPLLTYVASLLLSFKVTPAETAYDIVHDVLINFNERWPKSKARIDSVESLHSYLRVSCRNLLVDRYRRQRNAEQMVNFLSLKFSKAFQDESDVYSAIFINEIIEKLPPKCASLLRKYVTEDLSPAEVADSLNESPAAFYSRWYRCIEKAKKIFLKRKDGLGRL